MILANVRWHFLCFAKWFTRTSTNYNVQQQAMFFATYEKDYCSVQKLFVRFPRSILCVKCCYKQPLRLRLLANLHLISLKKFILETNLSICNHPMIFFCNNMHPSEYEIPKHVPVEINWEFLRYYWNTYKIVAVKFRKLDFNISLLKVEFTGSLRDKRH